MSAVKHTWCVLKRVVRTRNLGVWGRTVFYTSVTSSVRTRDWYLSRVPTELVTGIEPRDWIIIYSSYRLSVTSSVIRSWVRSELVTTSSAHTSVVSSDHAQTHTSNCPNNLSRKYTHISMINFITGLLRSNSHHLLLHNLRYGTYNLTSVIYGYTHPIKLRRVWMYKTFTVLTVSIIFKIVLIRAGRHVLHKLELSLP
jgi:hypothetical protein